MLFSFSFAEMVTDLSDFKDLQEDTDNEEKQEAYSTEC